MNNDKVWVIIIAVCVIMLVLAVLSFVRKSAHLALMFVAICIGLYIVGHMKLGSVAQVFVDKSAKVMETVTGSSRESMEERGHKALDYLEEFGNNVSNWVNE